MSTFQFGRGDRIKPLARATNTRCYSRKGEHESSIMIVEHHGQPGRSHEHSPRTRTQQTSCHWLGKLTTSYAQDRASSLQALSRIMIRHKLNTRHVTLDTRCSDLTLTHHSSLATVRLDTC
eukprot:927239-Rhodomonas_salina.1